MSTRVVDRVDEWDERSFTDGYRSLHDLSDEEFSGVIRAGGAELYMTKGAVVGIRRGSIDDFEDGTGTAYESPSSALPLLAIMQETTDEVRAEYYSEKTAISEVDSTLTDGGFTGYVELSDNVLSGDYYQVYHAGRSMSVGFVGASSKLIDGDEAFETANDEVGIYQVRPADIELIEIPEVESPPAGATDDADSDDASEGATTEDDRSGETPADVDDTTDRAPEGRETDESEAEPTRDGDVGAEQDEGDGNSDSATADTDPAVASTASTVGDDGSEPAQTTADGRSQSDREEARATTDASSSANQQTVAENGAQSTESSPARPEAPESREQSSETAETGPAHPQTADPSGPGGQQRERANSRRSERQTSRSTGTSGSETDLETRAIPSLDPERTADPDDSGGNARADTFTRPQDRAGNQRSPASTTTGQRVDAGTAQSTSEADQPQSSTASESSPSTDTATESDQSGTSQSSPSVDSERLEELESKVAERETEIDRLESELDRKTTEYEDAKSQLETLREERDELAAQVDRLEGELEQLETQFGAATDADRRMTPAEALSQTDIFPRYNSKGDATLKKAHGGSHRQEDVFGNLRLEQNTQFDASSVSVSGQTYDEFLESTLEYRFVNWVVGNLLFEIRETGHEKSLKGLYDSLPVIDWADLKGTVDVVYTEEGQETRSQESFDIVLRNRMGEPLIVANLNDSRQGATKSMMENLIRSAERVGQSSDAFAGAFLVTRSFFEPPALETADDATKGGLLSRDKRKSFVNLSRKSGYHLCLVEARNENFTLLVPEL